MLFMTLLPYPSFSASVESYSDFTLYLTLRALFKNHGCLDRGQHSITRRQRNIWTLWSEWEQSYIRLAMMCIEKAKCQGIPYNQSEATELLRAKRGKHWDKPLWAGWERLHSQHRAALLQIGAIEQISHRIIKWRHAEDASKADQYELTQNWLARHHFSLIESENSGNNEVNDYLSDQGAPPPGIPNHYHQFNWTERPDGYITACPPSSLRDWMCKA